LCDCLFVIFLGAIVTYHDEYLVTEVFREFCRPVSVCPLNRGETSVNYFVHLADESEANTTAFVVVQKE